MVLLNLETNFKIANVSVMAMVIAWEASFSNEMTEDALHERIFDGWSWSVASVEEDAESV